jgi:phosphoribosyl-dephospho-CoA transferase
VSVTIKEAATIAVSAVREFFEDQSISNVMFEEVDKDTAGNWLITVGFDRKATRINPVLGGALGNFSPFERKFKVAKVNAQGELLSVKDRLL